MKNLCSIKRRAIRSAYVIALCLLFFSCKKVAENGNTNGPETTATDYDNTVFESVEYTSSSAELSYGRRNMTSTTIGDSAIFIGGYTVEGSLGKFGVTDFYNAKTFTWTTGKARVNDYTLETPIGNWVFSPGVPYGNITDLRNGREFQFYLSNRRNTPVISKSGSLVIFAGGKENPNAVITDSNRIVDIYDLNTEKVVRTTKVPDTVRIKSAATLDGKVYLTCGDGTKPFTDIKFLEVYDLKTDVWSKMAIPKPLGKIHYSSYSIPWTSFSCKQARQADVICES